MPKILNFTDEQIRMMRTMYATDSSMTYAKIAGKFKCSANYVRHVVKGIVRADAGGSIQSGTDMRVRQNGRKAITAKADVANLLGVMLERYEAALALAKNVEGVTGKTMVIMQKGLQFDAVQDGSAYYYKSLESGWRHVPRRVCAGCGI